MPDPTPQEVVEAREEILGALQDHIKLKYHPTDRLAYIAGWEAAADAILLLKLKGPDHG